MVEINEVYLKLYRCLSRYIVIYGGRRSSKSWSSSQLIVWQALENPGRKIVILRKYATSIRLSVWARMMSALSEAGVLHMCKINKGERTITLPNSSEIIFTGADDPEKLKSIEEVGTYWLEEATEFSENDFNVLDAGLSTRVDPPPQFFLTFNPVPSIAGYQHWIQKRFLHIEHDMSVPRTVGNVTVLRTWYKDNVKCPQATIDLLESYRESNPALYTMWARGEFTALEGSILTNWDVVEKVPAGVRFVGYGVDFGYANDPAAVAAVWQRRDELWLEQKVYQTGLTNPDLSEAMEAVDIRKGIDDLVGDNAEPKTIQELRNLGWIIRPGDKGRDYKRAAALFLQSKRIHALENSPDLHRELATWSWKQDKEGHVLPIVADGNDHLIDAVIYRTFTKEAAVPIEAVEEATTDESAVFGSVIDESVPALGGAV